MEQFAPKDRPLYFISKDYNPSTMEAFSDWNVIKEPISDLSSWIINKLEYHALNDIDETLVKSPIQCTISHIRSNYTAIKGMDVLDSTILHMYVCESMIQLILLCTGKELPKGHGYMMSKELEFSNIGCNKTIDGLAASLHSLFFETPIPNGKCGDLDEAFLFIPELRKFFLDKKKFVRNFHCGNDDIYNATGEHLISGHFHSCIPIIDQYCTVFLEKEAISLDKLFPELQGYSISSFTTFSVEDKPYADDFISTTHDIDGRAYALGFGESKFSKMRDIEIRFYILFCLSSLARYHPEIWVSLKSDPEYLYIIRTFLEKNLTLFPLQVLRYLTGRKYTFMPRAYGVFG